MTAPQHAARVALLMVVAAALLGWELRHTETSFADGLRYIHRAEKIDAADGHVGLSEGIDHPLHPLAIAAAHRLLGGSGPDSWQRAALALCYSGAIAMVIPIYLLSLELFGEATAWLACLLAASNPIIGYIVVNVLSESTFLLWWSCGLWAAVRFLRAGQFRWLSPAIVFSALAYLTRPEGLLLPAALTTTLLILPLVRATKSEWPRRWRFIPMLLGGLVLLVGPYMTLKGGVGTKPGIARVLGLAPRSQPLALEREKPLPPGQTTLETYRIATVRMFKAFRAAVTPTLFPVALVGLLLLARRSDCGRSGLFLAILLVASAVALVRLHATGGYLTVRHGLIPGLILSQSAAFGLTWLIGRLPVAIRRDGLANGRLRPGALAWTLAVALAIMALNMRSLGPPNAGPFAVYQDTGRWLAHNVRESDPVLDLTDWSLFFGRRPGYLFANVYEALGNPGTRWIVARKPHIDGHCHYSEVIRELIGERQPVALVPPEAESNQIQVLVYDRQAPSPLPVVATSSLLERTRRR
jgi:4-amino-4-deoxy-L-arabinose transferase-like glycosyltransferase